MNVFKTFILINPLFLFQSLFLSCQERKWVIYFILSLSSLHKQLPNINVILVEYSELMFLLIPRLPGRTVMLFALLNNYIYLSILLQ